MYILYLDTVLTLYYLGDTGATSNKWIVALSKTGDAFGVMVTPAYSTVLVLALGPT